MTTKPPKPGAERQRDHRTRQEARGLSRICVYVPEEDRVKLQNYAKRLRDKNTIYGKTKKEH